MIKYTQRLVTPEEARKLLTHNINNRALRTSIVRRLADDMRNGHWRTTHQGIAIASTGRILDGQHRLHAIVEANTPVQLMVATGLDEDAFRYIDCGQKRLAADRVHLFEDHALNRRACAIVTSYLRDGVGTHPISVDDLESCFLEMSESARYVAEMFERKTRFIAVAPVGAALMCFHSFEPQKASEFADMLLSGLNLGEGSPALALREGLIGRRLRDDAEIYWKTINACKLFLQGEPMMYLTATTEDFRGNTFDREQRRLRKRGLLASKSRRDRLAQRA